MRSFYTMAAHFPKPVLSCVSTNSKSTNDVRLRHAMVFGILETSHLVTPFNELLSHNFVHKFLSC